MAHWREAVDVYEHDGSMLGLDNIVRLETILGDKVGYDAYHRINSATEYLGEWLEQGLLVREAADGARRTAGSGGVPLNWIRGRLDEWIRTAPVDPDARYTWTAGLADQSERDVMRVWAEDELAQVVEDHYWNFPGGRDSCMEFFEPGLHLRILRGMEGGTAVGRRPRTHGPRGHGPARRPARVRRDRADTLNGNL